MPKLGMVPTHNVKKSTTSTTAVKNATFLVFKGVLPSLLTSTIASIGIDVYLFKLMQSPTVC